MSIFKVLLLFLFSIFVTSGFSKELALNDLLKKYEISQELYLKTKKESAGHVIVFSRSDLDRMQAFTLNDVLKTLRVYSIQTSKLGMTTLVKSSSSQVANNPVKIYINSHELNSATLGNALTQYGKMGLYFVDHIEIYQGGNSITFGNEPASMIIKLYTKEPSRENGIFSQVSIDTKAGTNLRVIDAQSLEDYSYMINLDISKNNYKTYKKNNYELSRDGTRGQFNFKFSKQENYDIEMGATNEEYDSFNGLGSSPTGGSIDNSNFYIQFTKYFDNKLKLLLNVATEKLHVDTRDDKFISIPDGTTANKLEANVQTDIYAIALEKYFLYKNNDLFVGLQAKEKNFSINKFKTDGIDKPMIWGPTKLTIYMAYLENLYNINENNLITLSAKLDHYKNSFSKSSTEHILRLGYVSLLNDKWTFKIFGSKNYTYPIFRQTTFSGNMKINPDLNSASSAMLTGEAIYKTDKATFNFGFGNIETTDAIVFNKIQKKYINNPKKSRFKRVYLRTNYQFNIDNKVAVEYFKIYNKKNFSPDNGALIQLFNKIGKFDIYNELVYRSKYTSIDSVNMSAGYDYTLGIAYPINKRTNIKIKGENLLNRASEAPINGIDVSVVQRRGLLTMEYTF